MPPTPPQNNLSTHIAGVNRVASVTHLDAGSLIPRGSFFQRTVELIKGVLRIDSSPQSVQRANDAIAQRFYAAATEHYGRNIADTVVAGLLEKADTEQRITREDLSQAIFSADKKYQDIKTNQDVRKFLPAADASSKVSPQFMEIAQQYALRTPQSMQRYEHNLINLLATDSNGFADIKVKADLAASAASGNIIRRYEADEHPQQAVIADLKSFEEEFATSNARGISSATDHHYIFRDSGRGFIYFSKMNSAGNQEVYDESLNLNRHKNKIHVSVHIDDLHRAKEKLLPLLLSPDNPFQLFKMTNVKGEAHNIEHKIARCEAQRGPTPEEKAQEINYIKNASSRVVQGTQITLYPYTEGDEYSDQDINRFKNFTAKIEATLAEANIKTGSIPESDAHIDGFKYASFRNEDIGTRGTDVGEAPVTEEMVLELKGTQFYKSFTQVEPRAQATETTAAVATDSLATQMFMGLAEAARGGVNASRDVLITKVLDSNHKTADVERVLIGSDSGLRRGTTALANIRHNLKPETYPVEVLHGTVEQWRQQTGRISGMAGQIAEAQFNTDVKGGFTQYGTSSNNPFTTMASDHPQYDLAVRAWLADGIELTDKLLLAQERAGVGEAPLPQAELEDLQQQVNNFADMTTRS